MPRATGDYVRFNSRGDEEPSSKPVLLMIVGLLVAVLFGYGALQACDEFGC